MPRANRYYIPGNIWHITHRCHDRKFLLKFKKDRICWKKWLFEAKKRFNISVLNYVVTCNHVHLLIYDDTDGKIPEFMQLIQSRTAQEYNFRKHRKGAFWEDRYHATAIGSDEHLLRCMVYISMNMVRAGVVNHPVKWEESGYFEIENPKERYSLLDYVPLLKILNLQSIKQLQKLQQDFIKNALESNLLKREGIWTETIAVGDKDFVNKVRQELNFRAFSRKITQTEEGYVLSENEFPYKKNFKS
jgi:putative transposase